MEKLVIYKNKGETFKCQFEVDGVKPDDIEVRLCLEFGDNKNMFFYGKLGDNGECTIQIPKLPEIVDKLGKMKVEAIADSTYFKLYECEINLKNSVDVKMKKTGFFEQKETVKDAKIQLSNIERAEETVVEPVEEEVEEKVEEKSSSNPFLRKPSYKEKLKETAAKNEPPSAKKFFEFLKKN